MKASELITQIKKQIDMNGDLDIVKKYRDDGDVVIDDCEIDYNNFENIFEI